MMQIHKQKVLCGMTPFCNAGSEACSGLGRTYFASLQVAKAIADAFDCCVERAKRLLLVCLPRI